MLSLQVTPWTNIIVRHTFPTSTIGICMYVCMYVCMYGLHIYQSMGQPGKVKVANPARGQLKRESNILCPRSRLRIWPRETGSSVLSHAIPLILHTQDKPGAYSRDFSRFSRRRLLIFTAIRSVPSLFGHAIAFVFKRPKMYVACSYFKGQDVMNVFP